jgi:hypothetical protein
MVESNNSERLARIEDMIRALERETAVLKKTTAKIIDVVQVTHSLTTRRTSGQSAQSLSSDRRRRPTAKATLRVTRPSAAKRRG